MKRTQSIVPVTVERELGRYSSGERGPLLVVTAGLHGNEPGGVHALRRVFATLAERQPRVRGEFVALAGNRWGLARDTRFHDEDMNRLWTADQVRALRERAPERDHSEHSEQRELLAAIEGLLATERERVSLLDLHSTSGGGPPFTVMGDTLQNREIAFELGVPVLLGLEENIEGTLIEYVGGLGHVAVVLEGGQNQDPRTIDNHESAVWITLVSAGLLTREQVPDYEAHRARLRAAADGLPHVVEVLHRHDIEPEHETCFRMIPGLRSFQSIEKGRLLAHSGECAEQQVLAPFSGVLLMPRYQQKGLDGFFMGRSIEPFWLRISAAMRRMHLERVVSLLPGVKLEARNGNVIAVDPKVARFFTVEFFHLLGYRKKVERERKLVFSRRNDRL
ncbi:MAG: succinylglutamate desuccinylase/aspartoacylase family protein [Planctomycetes bacterium]|nr:succinylglutamate desuccinylase/aspartoacylase family protein [Planctomycetota bacterium]